MNRVALKMLMGDRSKYLALVLGLSFAVLLIAQQGSIFLGLMLRASGFLQNITQPDLWVADPATRYIGEIRSLPDRVLYQVRSVPGVAWAEPFFSARAVVELPNGQYKTGQLLGVDRTTLVGQPPVITAGRVEDLRLPDAVIVEESGREKLGGVELGDTLILNNRRAVVVAFAQAKLGFESNAMIYTTTDRIDDYVPLGRDWISFVLVKTKDGADIETVKADIAKATGASAFTPDEMRWNTAMFILNETGIGINFGITVALGFVVGLIVAAATFYQFTLENLRHFAVLKAMGASRTTLLRMILLQALLVGVIGYGVGVGGAGLFSLTGRSPGSELAVYFPWQLLIVSFVAMVLCVSAASLLSLRRVLTLDPAMIFQ